MSRQPSYPLRELVVGESRFLPDAFWVNVRCAIVYCRKTTGMHFSMRKQRGGVTVRRTA